ncbi:MAG: transposase family protein [Chlamydiae bacterium]|nr:transposase family protein [Chlamydiota bacterium]
MRGSFSDFPNHRITSRCIYPIWYIFLVILSGYLAGCNTVADLAYFAKLRSAWFINLIGIEDKAPSYNTFSGF